MRWPRSLVLVAAFAVVDVVVLGLAYALTHHEAEPQAAPPPASVSTPASDATPPITGPLTLTASPAGGIARVTRGSCDARQPVSAEVWVAKTYRAPLTKVTVPGLQESLGVALTDDRLTIVGAAKNCTVASYVSSDGGATWQVDPVGKDAVWYVDRDTTKSSVHGPVPGGVVNLDCTPTGVTTLDAGARALVTCSDFNVLEVSTQPGSATRTFAVTKPAGAGQIGTGAPVALGTTDSCGAAVLQLRAEGDNQQLACLGNEDAPLGLAVSGRRIFAQVGYHLLVSADAGGSFAAYPSDPVASAAASASPSATP